MNNEKREKILFLMQVPPPVTGASLRNMEIFNMRELREQYAIKLIPFIFAKNVSDLSVFSILKIVKGLKISFLIVINMIFFRPDFVYMTPVPKGFAYLRDVINIFLVKLFRKKTVFHLRSLGFGEKSKNSLFFRILNRMIFENVYVIALSGTTAKDIERIYKGKIFIVNDGIKDENPVADFNNRKAGIVKIVFFSNLFLAKGIVNFLEILSILKNVVRFSGEIYGQEGDLSEKELMKFVDKLGLSDFVSYKGEVPDRKSGDPGKDGEKGERKVFKLVYYREI